MEFPAVFIILMCVYNGNTELSFKYHENEELLEYMRNFSGRFPNISRLYSIGSSVRGIDLLVLKITTSQDFLAPNVKLIGNIHGNEAITREVLLHFIEYIGTSHSVDANIQKLLNTTVIHILPSMNPDGFSILQVGLCKGSQGRNNAKDVDLNRNFPDYHYNLKSIEQPETSAIRQWLNTTRFVLSASLHSGTLVANYPFDSPQVRSHNAGSRESKAPDDDVLRHLALSYSKAHPNMRKGNACKDGYVFPNGITNGAKWYDLKGGMGDYNYAFGGVMELTLEISCCKFPMTKFIGGFVNENKMALITFISQAQRGVRGVIMDFDVHTNPRDIALMIEDRDVKFYPDVRGRFWRILLPGTYTLVIIFKNETHMTMPFSVNDTSATVLKFHLFATPTEGANQADSTIQANTTSPSTSVLNTTIESAPIYLPTYETSDSLCQVSLHALLHLIVFLWIFN